MELIEFHTQAVEYFKRISMAVEADTSTIDSMTILGHALVEALNFFGEAFDAIDDAPTRQHIEEVAMELAGFLMSNTAKLRAAMCAEAELSDVMNECVRVVTLH